MVYRIIILSEEDDFFRREIRIDSEATFQQFNDFLVEHLGFSSAELTTFYISDEAWSKGQEVTAMDMRLNSDEDSYLMSETQLEELIEGRGDRLIFVFDMLSERALFMEVVEELPGKSLPEPEVTRAEGKAPTQTSTLEFAETRAIGTAAAAAVAFDEDDFLTDEELDLDELDPDGFTDLDSLEGY